MRVRNDATGTMGDVAIFIMGLRGGSKPFSEGARRDCRPARESLGSACIEGWESAMMTRRGSFFAAALALSMAPVAPGLAASEAQRVLPMATGDVTGSYFPAGVALCRVVNEGRREHGLRCAAVPTQASVDNVARLRGGEVDLAMVQSDAQDAAWRGAGAFAEAGPFAELRAVMALFPEPLTLVVRAESGIAALGDLPGKRISVGPPASGQRALIDALVAGLGWRDTAFEALELDPAAAVNALCEGRIDGFFYAVGQPALAIQEATSSCGATLVDIAGPEVDALVAADPFYFATEIPAGLYAGVDRPVPSFGVGATLVTRADLADAEIETVTTAILDALGELAGFDPTLAGLDAAEMPRQGLTAPLHPGAEAAFRAQGLME